MVVAVVTAKSSQLISYVLCRVFGLASLVTALHLQGVAADFAVDSLAAINAASRWRFAAIILPVR